MRSSSVGAGLCGRLPSRMPKPPSVGHARIGLEALTYYLQQRRRLLASLGKLGCKQVSEYSPEFSEYGTQEDPVQLWAVRSEGRSLELVAKYWVRPDENGLGMTFVVDAPEDVIADLGVAHRLILH